MQLTVSAVAVVILMAMSPLLLIGWIFKWLAEAWQAGEVWLELRSRRAVEKDQPR